MCISKQCARNGGDLGGVAASMGGFSNYFKQTGHSSLVADKICPGIFPDHWTYCIEGTTESEAWDQPPGYPPWLWLAVQEGRKAANCRAPPRQLSRKRNQETLALMEETGLYPARGCCHRAELPSAGWTNRRRKPSPMTRAISALPPPIPTFCWHLPLWTQLL